MKDWIPVSTPPSKPGIYAILVRGIPACYKIGESFNAANWAEMGATHWCEFPPPPDKFEAWWKNFPMAQISGGKYRIINGYETMIDSARTIWQAALASKEAK